MWVGSIEEICSGPAALGDFVSDLLDFLLNLPRPLPVDGSEADTRACVIDPLLSCLGWSGSDIKREPFAGWTDSRGFIDYLLLQDGRPIMVLEAKRTGRTFSVPQKLTSQRITTYKKIRATASQNLVEALEQCLRYSQHTGAVYACATNGADWIFFKPSHSYRALPDARIVIFNGIDQITKRVDEFVDLLGYVQVEEGKAEKALLGREIKLPSFSKRLQDAFPYHEDPTLEEEDYSNILDQFLTHYITELTSEVDFEECYCAVRANRTTVRTIEALVSGAADITRPDSERNPRALTDELLAPSVFPDLPSGRTVILHGEVGVGKSSFLRHCELQLTKAGALNHAVWAKVDLLSFQDRSFTATDRDEMLQLICKDIQARVADVTGSMSGSYDPDEWVHLRDIYNSEVRKYQKARYPDSDDSDRNFIESARQFVWEISQKDAQDHLVRVIRWLTINCRLPVVVALDNSDQLGLEFQTFLYKLSESLKSATSAVVILVLRTEALASHSIKEHSIASVREQFLVQKAPLAQVLGKRFGRILKRLPEAYYATAQKVAMDRVSTLIDTIGYEADIGSDAFQIVQAAGNGSLRDNLRAVSAIFRSSPRSMDKLVVDQYKRGRARLSVALVLRAIMKDDLASADANKLLPNIFSVDSQVMMPYALGLRILQQVRSKGARIRYDVASILNDFSVAGVDRVIVERTLQRLRHDRFITVAHMLPELRGVDLPRLARLGDVMIDMVLGEMSYVSRAAFETYIYNKDIYNDMRSAWTSGIGEYYKKFSAIGRLFASMVREDDVLFRREIDCSHLEPVINSQLPGVLSDAGEQSNVAENG